MSETEILPGRVLSPLGPQEFTVAEREFSAEHLHTAAEVGAKLPKVAGDKLLELALWDVRSGAFNYMSPGFEAKCMSVESLPLLLWLSLRVKDEKITRTQAAELITPENYKAIHFRLLTLAGVPVRLINAVAEPTQTEPAA